MDVATNSIACTDASNSLLRIFNLTSGNTHPLTFPGKECKSAYSRCDKCLQIDQCQVNGGCTPLCASRRLTNDSEDYGFRGECPIFPVAAVES